jgi:hypothetical protein
MKKPIRMAAKLIQYIGQEKIPRPTILGPGQIPVIPHPKPKAIAQ